MRDPVCYNIILVEFRNNFQKKPADMFNFACYWLYSNFLVFSVCVPCAHAPRMQGGRLPSPYDRKEGAKFGTLHEFACHPCAGAMLIFSVSFQF